MFLIYLDEIGRKEVDSSCILVFDTAPGNFGAKNISYLIETPSVETRVVAVSYIAAKSIRIKTEFELLNSSFPFLSFLPCIMSLILVWFLIYLDEIGRKEVDSSCILVLDTAPGISAQEYLYLNQTPFLSFINRRLM